MELTRTPSPPRLFQYYFEDRSQQTTFYPLKVCSLVEFLQIFARNCLGILERSPRNPESPRHVPHDTGLYPRRRRRQHIEQNSAFPRTKPVRVKRKARVFRRAKSVLGIAAHYRFRSNHESPLPAIFRPSLSACLPSRPFAPPKDAATPCSYFFRHLPFRANQALSPGRSPLIEHVSAFHRQGRG